MSKAEIIEELRRMPEAERRELVESIRSEFGDFDAELSEEQKAEFERRAAELRKNPKAGVPWEHVCAEAKRRLKARRAA
jgi:putative addiction module component (TIGR02574 family)